jgi:hypothetical protein
MQRAIRDAVFKIGFGRAAKEKAIGARPTVRPAAGDVGKLDQRFVLARRHGRGIRRGALFVFGPPPSPRRRVNAGIFVRRTLCRDVLCRDVRGRLVGVETQPMNFTEDRRARQPAEARAYGLRCLPWLQSDRSNAIRS